MPNRLSLGKHKFDTWFSLSKVLHDSSVRLRNPLSYIHTYELSTGNIKEDMVCEGILAQDDEEEGMPPIVVVGGAIQHYGD
jgi:hypothetical protein